MAPPAESPGTTQGRTASESRTAPEGRTASESRTAPESRKASTDEKLFQATLDILRDEGIGAVTVEAIAARSGVAKTTIYRRYADRHEVLRAALDHYLPALSLLDSADPRRALLSAIRMMSTAVERYIGTAFATVLSDRQSPTAAIILEKVVRPRIEAMTRFLRASRDAGQLRPDIDENTVISMIIGSVNVHYARFGRFEEHWPETFVAHLWPCIAPPATPPNPATPPTG